MASIRNLLILTLMGLAIASPAPPVSAAGGYAPTGEADDDEFLKMPGLPSGPQRMPGPYDFGLRQGQVPPNARHRDPPENYGTVIGPGGIVKPMPAPSRKAEKPAPKVLTPDERAAAIRKALTPKPPLAVARRRTLDDLYAKLAASSDEDEAKGLATLIASIWIRTGSDTAALLMQRAGQAIARQDYRVALDVLDKVVELQPNWAEGWNKRATVRFLAGDLDGSMSDVEHTLRIEPKHFGALQGMAMILQKTGFDKQALEIYRRVLAIYPHQPELKDVVDKLTLQVEGQGI